MGAHQLSERMQQAALLAPFTGTPAEIALDRFHRGE
jgi:hypothetical protein